MVQESLSSRKETAAAATTTTIHEISFTWGRGDRYYPYCVSNQKDLLCSTVWVSKLQWKLPNKISFTDITRVRDLKQRRGCVIKFLSITERTYDGT